MHFFRSGTSGGSGGSGDGGWVRPKDRHGKALQNRWTTERVEECLVQPSCLCGSVLAVVSNTKLFLNVACSTGKVCVGVPRCKRKCTTSVDLAVCFLRERGASSFFDLCHCHE